MCSIIDIIDLTTFNVGFPTRFTEDESGSNGDKILLVGMRILSSFKLIE
jgi:hypothetical protein